MSGTVPPALTVYANGVGIVSDQQLNSFVQGAALLADARNFVGISGMSLWLNGLASAGDGGQGNFYWNSTSTTPDDAGVTTITPYGLLTGRWLRLSGGGGSTGLLTLPTIAALRALASGVSPVFVAGYYAAGDGGGGFYTLGSAGTDNSGTIIVSGAGTYYLELFGGPVSVLQFGAKFDGATNDRAAWQNAVDWVCSTRNSLASGGILTAPAGFSSVGSAILPTGPIIIQGAGDGAGTGTGNSGGTVIRSSSASANVFTIDTTQSVQFRDLRIDYAATGSTGTGIAITPSGSGINLGSVIERCTISGFATCLGLTSCANYTVASNRILDFGAVGIYDAATASNPDVGDATITGNVVWAQNTTATDSCIRLNPAAGVEVSNNKLLGAVYGVRLTVSQGPTGTLNVFGNSIEAQTVTCVRIEQGTAGKIYGDIIIANNELSIITTAAQAAVQVVAGAALYLTNVDAHDNAINFSHAGAFATISIQDGNNVKVHDNLINLNNTAGPSGITTGGNVSKAWVEDNTFIGVASTSFYSGGLSSTTVLRDSNGITFASLGSWANGSQVYVTDGAATAAGNPVLVGSGSGAVALRARGNWYTAQYGVTG